MASRTQAAQWVIDGRVRVNGTRVLDPEFPVRRGVDVVMVDDVPAAPSTRLVIMLNKPRGLITTRHDDQGRDTVYMCLQDDRLPWLAPVGRLDKASEGLLLLTNDPEWAARITSPVRGPPKTYHVQIDRLPHAELLTQIERGVTLDGELLTAKTASCLRSGAKHAWLEIVLEEGRNRQIRRLLAAFDVAVLRLVRVAIGPLVLGTLSKGAWRVVTEKEIQSLVSLD